MNVLSLPRRRVLQTLAGLSSLLVARHAVRAADSTAASAAAAGRVSLGGDLTVKRLGFGAMRITGPGIWGEPPDRDAAHQVLRRALELGVDFIDTADAYGPEVSERLIAEALYPYPRGLVIATKGGLVRPGAGSWTPDGRPEHLREACEASLKRLRLERIDLYQLHRIDPKVPLEDSVGELARLRAAGKIRHVGVSNFSVDELARARRIVPIVSVQNRYNVGDRDSQDVLDVCTRERLVFIPWAPLGRGTPRSGLAALARQKGVSELQLAIAWLLAKSAAMLPIPGTSLAAHLEEDVAAAAIRLTPQEMQAIG